MHLRQTCNHSCLFYEYRDTANLQIYICMHAACAWGWLLSVVAVCHSSKTSWHSPKLCFFFFVFERLTVHLSLSRTANVLQKDIWTRLIRKQRTKRNTRAKWVFFNIQRCRPQHFQIAQLHTRTGSLDYHSGIKKKAFNPVKLTVHACSINAT